MTTSYDTINTLLEVSAHAAHVVVARTTRKRSLTQNEPWHWYMEWRLCVLTTAGRDAILPYYESPADQNALFGERPTIVQERRVDVAPDGALKERAWDSYNPFRTPWEAIWRNGTGIIKADESLHPLHAFAVERWQRYSALTSERQQLVTQRDRVRPPDLNTRQGQRADQQAFNARGEQALKDARLYTKWVRAQYEKHHGGWGVPQVTGDDDLFGALARDYPLAWERLRLLATAPAQEHDLVVPDECLFSMPPAPATHGRNTITPIVLSGYDLAIDAPLRARLDAIQSGMLEIVFAPTFKWLTRNPAKLLYVIEAIIAAGGTFCTLNYLIRRDYCARREALVRPPHKEEEILPALRVYDGLVARHRTVIQHVAAAEPTE